MTHDPMCPFFYDHTAQELVRQTGNPCIYCDLIARVRQQEQTLAQQRVNLTIAAWSEQVEPTKTAARRVALRDAITAANNRRSKFKARDWDDAIDAVVAAIEALGGER